MLHPLDGPDRDWAETNCYTDLWIGLLRALGMEPMAVLAFTAAQDFEGDQFTFFKPPPEDLRRLYGLEVQELALYDRVEAHAGVQAARGRPVLVEVDGFHLPDTRGTSYRAQHVKTTIAILGLDAGARRLDYIHNAGRFTLEGEDYDGLFGPAPLFPYAEFVKRSGPALKGAALMEASRGLLSRHLRHRPAENPIAAFRAALPEQLEALLARPMDYFHLYAFNTLRQVGANFELLGLYLRWVGGPADAAESCATLSATAKALQFQLARGVNRRRFGDCAAPLDAMERAYGTALGALIRRYG
ncbi:DUF1839 family protein [Azospirillum isscasi]|uniref:DUF1839 family protein n=1 Tax=Azospirillum isscasi TaxID=3053926 RepID=A0ABU0WQV1_9PROT|nr:DUF1839 family protein [Azospirillum isscasi]MDQ2106625.1 DUF1839 family protein [Azospirillum isscasi]